MRADIAAINGVRSAMANRLTGSIVVEYDRYTLSPSALSEALRERGIACDASTNRVGKQAIATSSLGHALGVAAERLLEWIVERLAITIIAAVI